MNAYLVPVENRQHFPEVPADRFRRSYIYARVNGKANETRLASIAERITGLKSSAVRIGRPGVPSKYSEKERLDLLRNLFDEEVKAMQDSDGLSPAEARNRAIASILQRPGQARFRNRLLGAYKGVCAISDCDWPEALEAAHIQRYADGGKDHITNGLLLRADLHRLFDRGKIRIDPGTGTVVVSNEFKKTTYQSFHGRPPKSPTNPAHKPNSPTAS
jgi:hypothetical protein